MPHPNPMSFRAARTAPSLCMHAASPGLLACAVATLVLLALPPVAVAGDPPIPIEVYPSGANVGGGNSVVIFGTDIGTDIENTTVTIGGTPATIIANTPGDIEVTVPPRATAGVVSVIVHKTSGPIQISDAFVYRHDHQGGRDFAHQTNPNGPWQYGFSATRTAPFTLFTAPPTQASCVHVWFNPAGSPSGVPAVARNRNSSACTNIATWQWPAGRIGGHPANDGANAVVRFTVPAAASYHVSGDFTGADPVGPTSSDAAVLLNDVELFSANVGYNVAQTFDLHLDLNAGDTLDFKVGHGGNGYAYDQTTMQIDISGNILHVDGFE